MDFSFFGRAHRRVVVVSGVVISVIMVTNEHILVEWVGLDWEEVKRAHAAKQSRTWRACRADSSSNSSTYLPFEWSSISHKQHAFGWVLWPARCVWVGAAYLRTWHSSASFSFRTFMLRSALTRTASNSSNVWSEFKSKECVKGTRRLYIK